MNAARDTVTATATAEAGASRGESVARAYDQVRELIVWGRLSPGSRIVESEIADRLGISRTPTRSALHRLQQEGKDHAIELVGSRLRAMMPWISAGKTRVADASGGDS